MRPNTPEKFWSKCIPVPECGCWIWEGSEFHFGHGEASYQGKHLKAHRLAWILTYGDIPDGLCVLHRCDTPQCINPRHLFLGTKADNTKDRDNKKRTAFGEKGGMSKLTDEKVKKIKNQLHRTNVSLSKEFGVDQTAISSIRHNKTWKHIG